VTNPCRLDLGNLIAYQDGTLPPGRREIVEAHLAACRHCQARLAAFYDVDRILQTKALPSVFPEHRRSQLRARLNQEGRRQGGGRRYLRLRTPRSQPILTKVFAALLMLFAVVPAATQAGFPLDRVVHFAEIKIKQALPLDAQDPIQHVDPAAPNLSSTAFHTVAPRELPLGLLRVEQSRPDPDRVETLYRGHDSVAILIAEVPAEVGQVTLNPTEADLMTVRGTQVVYLRDPRPEAVSALFWERDGVFFEVLVIEAPRGAAGGLEHTEAVLIVEALIREQDAMQE
jgi:hypothetical protein